GRVIYIGKARELKRRVSSYIGAPDSRVFASVLREKASDVEVIVTANETEALILENNLIKKFKPVYNIRLKDDKAYVYLQVTVTERWPRVLIVRRPRKEGDLYFGPYGSASAVRRMLRVIREVFPLRTCSNRFFADRERPCIQHEIGRCCAPCVGLAGEAEYRRHVEQVILFLRGRSKEVVDALRERMLRASEAREYEAAARIRDRIRAIERAMERQNAEDLGLGDLDAFALHAAEGAVTIQGIHVRDGRVVGAESAHHRTPLEAPEILAAFLSQYYMDARPIPPEILCPVAPDGKETIEAWLRGRRGGPVRIRVPRSGERRKLLAMAERNAALAASADGISAGRTEEILRAVADALGLAEAPRRIECFDVSLTGGELPVGAAVVFVDGEPARERYRRFRIKTVAGPDDFAMLEEILRRRLERSAAEDDLPDLILIDGGKGQLSRACAVAAEVGATRVAIASIAKARRREGRETDERIFVPGRREPLPLDEEAPASRFLQRIRDEAHRFAISFHRELRRKAALRTGLERVPGVGPKRRSALLERFGTLRAMRKAGVDELARVVPRETAEAVHRFLREQVP
ncbi:MAG: excinuclease ABC subunit UvrC, partial [Planctomycetes bacterium]|nr:excinuclease ABC subunit UvrC [Planctomycetota bacterium]